MNQRSRIALAFKGGTAAAVVVVGGYATTLAWIIASLKTGGRAGWMALVVAGVASAAIGFMHPARRSTRALGTVLLTMGYLVVGEWMVACLPLAGPMGLSPLDAAQRVGLDFGWTLIRIGNAPLDWVWIAFSLALPIAFLR